MAWTETTRGHYRREALHDANDLTNAEWAFDLALHAERLQGGAAEKDRSAHGGGGDPLHGLDRLPMARDPQELTALLDGARFRRLKKAGQRLNAGQPL